MQLLVSGSSGLVGSRLCRQLVAAGHSVRRLVRAGIPNDNTAGVVVWDPTTNKLDSAALSGTEAVVHLAGENIASGRWTAAQKARIRDSRVQGTALLAHALVAMSQPPQTLVCASAIGFYGHRADEWMTETSSPGQGFLPDVCRDWERATEVAREAGIRVVNLRIGVVLSRDGGALKKMLLPFRLGLGGVVGGGRQWMSWISIDDVVGVIEHCLHDRSLNGPVNAVSPHPVTNREFTKTLGRVLRRPTFFSMPAVAARLAFGQMADELLLSSTRVSPTRLIDTGFPFQFGKLEPALKSLLT